MSARPQPRNPLRSPRTYIRGAFTITVAAATLVVASQFLGGLHIQDWTHAFVAAIAITIANAVVWPLLIRVALPITVLTLGVAGMLLNGVIVWVALNISDGVFVDSFWAALVVAFLLTITNTVVTGVLGIDDDDFYYRNVIRRQARRHADTTLDEAVPGILFLEIDGLAEPVLRRAIRDGNVPELARWIREGTHRLEGWECDWSSQTSASQAGNPHVTNEDIPAFRWYEKERG
ncbi:MAG: phage holin family protein, partial [Actinomycetota bacterium]